MFHFQQLPAGQKFLMDPTRSNNCNRCYTNTFNKWIADKDYCL